MSDSKTAETQTDAKALLAAAEAILGEMSVAPEDEVEYLWIKKKWVKASKILDTLVGLQEKTPCALEPLCAAFLRSRHHDRVLAAIKRGLPADSSYFDPNRYKRVYMEPDIGAHAEKYREQYPEVDRTIASYRAWRKEREALCSDDAAYLEPTRQLMKP